MKYNPKKHHRKSIRLKGYDYTLPGAYFITICIHNRECLLGEIKNDKTIVNTLGRIVEDKWNNIPKHFKQARLDEFVVMPNHIHGILILMDRKNVGAKHSKTPANLNQKNLDKNASPLHKAKSSGSVPAIIQNFTSITTRKINQIRKTPGAKFWQRNYHEHIIRNEKELQRIRQYILNNPLKWELDLPREIRNLIFVYIFFFMNK